MLDIYKTLISGILEKAKTFKGDWNENDSVSPNYIKNRTHWTEDDRKTLINITVPMESFDVGNGEPAYVLFEQKLVLELNKTYYVTFNNKEYECISWRNDYGGVSIGNGSIFNNSGGNDEPFAFDSYSNGEIYFLMAIEDVKETKIKIEEKLKIFHKLDKEFLPDDVMMAIDEDRLDIIANEVFGGKKYAIKYLDSHGVITSMTYKKFEILEWERYENSFVFREHGVRIMVYMNDVLENEIITDSKTAIVSIPKVTGNLRIEIHVEPR